MRTKTSLMYLLLLVCLFTGCVAVVDERSNSMAQSESEELSPGGPNSAEEWETVRMIMLPYLSFAPLFIAQEEGYFAEQHIELEFIELHDTTQATPQFLQGNVDVIAGFLPPNMINGILHGAEAKIVADKGYAAAGGCTYIGLLEDAADPVTTLTEKRIALDPASFEGYYIDRLLAQEGLSLADIEVINISHPARLGAMGDGSLDLASTGEPLIQYHLNSGMKIYKGSQEITVDAAFAFIFYGDALLNDNPELGERFMTAYLKAVHQYNEGKTERNVAIVAEYAELAPELVEASCWPPIQDDGSINEASVMDYQAWALEQDLIDEIVPIEQLWETQFIEAASKALGPSTTAAK